ncbi:hypothetical protein AAMO2058_001370600 [Amorphochlora amoebiformis]
MNFRRSALCQGRYKARVIQGKIDVFRVCSPLPSMLQRTKMEPMLRVLSKRISSSWSKDTKAATTIKKA